MNRTIVFLLCTTLLAGCRQPTEKHRVALKTDADCIVAARGYAQDDARCRKIIASFPSILKNAQVLPSQAPVVAIRFDSDGRSVAKGASIIVNLNGGDGKLESIEVESAPEPSTENKRESPTSRSTVPVPAGQ